jgi:hypothetical protein
LFHLRPRSVVWTVLVLELIFEFLIRPSGYADLMVSDRAFAPSTARHINTFHLCFEFLALLTFVPEVACIANFEQCSQDGRFTRFDASLDAVVGHDHAHAAVRGRFILGITALRFFAVVRHWKQMWINNVFRSIGWERWFLGTPNEPADFDSASPGDNQSIQNKKNDVSEW